MTIIPECVVERTPMLLIRFTSKATPKLIALVERRLIQAGFIVLDKVITPTGTTTNNKKHKAEGEGEDDEEEEEDDDDDYSKDISERFNDDEDGDYDDAAQQDDGGGEGGGDDETRPLYRESKFRVDKRSAPVATRRNMSTRTTAATTTSTSSSASSSRSLVPAGVQDRGVTTASGQLGVDVTIASRLYDIFFGSSSSGSSSRYRNNKKKRKKKKKKPTTATTTITNNVNDDPTSVMTTKDDSVSCTTTKPQKTSQQQQQQQHSTSYNYSQNYYDSGSTTTLILTTEHRLLEKEAEDIHLIKFTTDPKQLNIVKHFTIQDRQQFIIQVERPTIHAFEEEFDNNNTLANTTTTNNNNTKNITTEQQQQKHVMDIDNDSNNNNNSKKDQQQQQHQGGGGSRSPIRRKQGGRMSRRSSLAPQEEWISSSSSSIVVDATADSSSGGGAAAAESSSSSPSTTKKTTGIFSASECSLLIMRLLDDVTVLRPNQKRSRLSMLLDREYRKIPTPTTSTSSSTTTSATATRTTISSSPLSPTSTMAETTKMFLASAAKSFRHLPMAMGVTNINDDSDNNNNNNSNKNTDEPNAGGSSTRSSSRRRLVVDGNTDNTIGGNNHINNNNAQQSPDRRRHSGLRRRRGGRRSYYQQQHSNNSMNNNNNNNNTSTRSITINSSSHHGHGGGSGTAFGSTRSLYSTWSTGSGGEVQSDDDIIISATARKFSSSSSSFFDIDDAHNNNYRSRQHTTANQYYSDDDDEIDRRRRLLHNSYDHALYEPGQQHYNGTSQQHQIDKKIMKEHGERSARLRNVLQTYELVDTVTPASIPHVRSEILRSTIKLQQIMPPVQSIQQYYGWEVAFYFAWMGFLIQWLLYPGIMGVIVALFRSYRSDTLETDEYTPFYGLLTFLWAILFLKFWTRHENRLAYHWGTYSLTSYEKQHYFTVRSEFYGYIRISPVTGQYETYYPRVYRRCKYFISSIVTCFMLFIAFSVMILSLNLQGYIRPSSNPTRWNDTTKKHPFYYEHLAQLAEEGRMFDSKSPIKALLPVVLHVACIFVLNNIYRYVAEQLTHWENHETAIQHANSVFLKRFLFEAFDCYIALFYLAFYERDVDRLRMELVAIFQIDTIRRVLLESVIPMILQRIHYNQQKKKQQQQQQQQQRNNNNNDGMEETINTKTKAKDTKNNQSSSASSSSSSASRRLLSERTRIRVMEDLDRDVYEQFDDYMEIIIQLGYVTLFASAFPMASLISIIANYIEVRSDAFKLATVCQRPQPLRSSGLGMWRTLMSGLIWTSALTNCLIAGFTSDQLMQFIPNLYTPTDDEQHEQQPGDEQLSSTTSRFMDDVASGATTTSRKIVLTPAGPEDNKEDDGLLHSDGLDHEKGWIVVFIIFGLERVLLLTALFISAMIPDLPQDVTDEIERRHYLRTEEQNRRKQQQNNNNNNNVDDDIPMLSVVGGINNNNPGGNNAGAGYSGLRNPDDDDYSEDHDEHEFFFQQLQRSFSGNNSNHNNNNSISNSNNGSGGSGTGSFRRGKRRGSSNNSNNNNNNDNSVAFWNTSNRSMQSIGGGGGNSSNSSYRMKKNE